MGTISRIAIALSLAATVLVLGACAAPPPRAEVTTVPRLEGTTWRLAGWSVSSLFAPDFAITARFGDGGVSGRSAVNTYRGAMTFGPGSNLAVAPLATTKMAGPEPDMRAEGIYLRLLGEAASYRLEGGRLTLFDGQGNERLIFERAVE